MLRTRSLCYRLYQGMRIERILHGAPDMRALLNQ